MLQVDIPSTGYSYFVITSSKSPLITLVVVAKSFYFYSEELTPFHIHFSPEQFVCGIMHLATWLCCKNWQFWYFKSLL